MPSLVSDYLPLVVFIAVAGVIGLTLLAAPFVVAYSNPDPEKVSAYECVLFPWAVAFHDIGAFGFWSMIIFLFVLTVGFVYEWNKGALEWD
jgi:NADH-quinone oxidoreductase subunit A